MSQTLTITAEQVLASAERIREDIVRDRRMLHAAPEVGTDLPNTVACVKKRLLEMGYQPRELAGGVVAEITGTATGRCLLLRADMDALRVTEQTGLDLADCLPAGQKAYVAAPMRWCGVMLALKDRLPGLHPYCARVICSSYLPDWRPGVDYRTVYSAHKAMGGGVTIDLIHEWDYLVELFGVPEKLYNFKGTYSDLEIDSDDLSVYIARYPTLLAEVHLDYFGRGYRRSIELFCHDGSYLADFGAGTLTLPDGTVQHYEEDVNRRYEREMEYFVDYALTGSGESCNPPALALNVLKLTLGENVQ